MLKNISLKFLIWAPKHKFLEEASEYPVCTHPDLGSPFMANHMLGCFLKPHWEHMTRTYVRNNDFKSY